MSFGPAANPFLIEPALGDGAKQPDRPKRFQVMGPGLITGASDDDPSGIATYSQVGAQFGVTAPAPGGIPRPVVS